MNIVDFKERELPDTPNSLINTPRELYRTPGEVTEPVLSTASSSSRKTRTRKQLSPQKVYSARARHFSLPLSPVIQESKRLVHCRTGSVSASKRRSLQKQRIYIPGPIRLADTSAIVSRRASVATLDPFVGEVEGARDSRRPSDIAAIDEIITFFKDFGVLEPATHECLDQFWIPKEPIAKALKDLKDLKVDTNRPLPPPPIPSAKALRRLGLDKAPPPSPRSPSVSSRPPIPPLPSSSSALFPSHQRLFREERQATPPSPSARQRVKLRRLLGSAGNIL